MNMLLHYFLFPHFLVALEEYSFYLFLCVTFSLASSHLTQWGVALCKCLTFFGWILPLHSLLITSQQPKQSLLHQEPFPLINLKSSNLYLKQVSRLWSSWHILHSFFWCSSSFALVRFIFKLLVGFTSFSKYSSTALLEPKDH